MLYLHDTKAAFQDGFTLCTRYFTIYPGGVFTKNIATWDNSQIAIGQISSNVYSLWNRSINPVNYNQIKENILNNYTCNSLFMQEGATEIYRNNKWWVGIGCMNVTMNTSEVFVFSSNELNSSNWTISKVIDEPIYQEQDPAFITQEVNGTTYFYIENENPPRALYNNTDNWRTDINLYTTRNISNPDSWNLIQSNIFNYSGIINKTIDWFDVQTVGTPLAWYESGKFYLYVEVADFSNISYENAGTMVCSSNDGINFSSCNMILSPINMTGVNEVFPEGIQKYKGDYYLTLGLNNGTSINYWQRTYQSGNPTTGFKYIPELTFTNSLER